jgi:hypothetical protein
MLKPMTRTACIFLLFAGSFAMAQEGQPVPGVLVNVKAKVVVADKESETPDKVAVHSDNQQMLAGVMSAVESSTSEMGTSTELVEQAGNTVIAAGSCTVVDLFVRQYCASNPGDISCQFQ